MIQPLLIFVISTGNNEVIKCVICYFHDLKSILNDDSFKKYIDPVVFINLTGPNLDLLCVQQSNAAPFCENYAKLYFDVKHLEKGLNRWCETFDVFFFLKKKTFLANIRCCPNFLD